MKFKIKCQTSLLSLALVICGAIFNNNLQAMSAAASAARQNVLADLQANIGKLEDISDINQPLLAQRSPKLAVLIPNINAALASKNFVANFTPITPDVSGIPVAGADGNDLNRGFALIDMAISRALGVDGEGPSNPRVLFDLLYLGAPALSYVNHHSTAGEYGPKLVLPMKLSTSTGIGTLYFAIQDVQNKTAANISSACTNTNVQSLVGSSDVNSLWLGASCTSNSNCCGNNVCNNGVCDVSGTPVTTCPTVPCPSGYSCNASGACVKNAPVACTASSCGVGNYCNVATGNCATGCLNAANCGGTTALCDTTLKTCVAQIQGTDSGCSKAADCALGLCDTTLSACVAQIPGTDTGCFKAADCVLGACSVSGGVIPGACSKPAGPVACTASSCGVGNYCNVATGNCVAGCLSAANCGGATALCDTTLKTCVAQIQGTDSGCSKATDCALGLCDTTLSACVAQIQGTDSGCFKAADCVLGACSVSGGVIPGACFKPAGPATCLTDAACGAGNYCDLSVGTCVTGATIPANDGCTTLGITGGCATGLVCQPTQAKSGPVNTCQSCTVYPQSKASSGVCQANGDPVFCVDATECCSCNCDTEGASPTYLCVP